MAFLYRKLFMNGIPVQKKIVQEWNDIKKNFECIISRNLDGMSPND